MKKTCSFAIAIGVAAAVSACGSVSGSSNSSAVLTGVDASGAVSGQAGRLRVLFSNPVGDTTTVKLTSTSPEIATIPDHVTLDPGAVSADVQFMGVAPGEVVFQAVAGDASISSATNVVDMVRVNPPSTTTIEVGGHGLISAGVNIRVPDQITVSLASSDPSVATVDGSVTIPQFDSSGIAEVNAVAPGASVITASLNGQQASQTVTVVQKAAIVSSYGSQLLEAGGHGFVQISLNAQLANPSMLTITPSDASVIMAPASYTLAAGSTFASIPVQAVSAGSTTLTLSLNGSTASFGITVLAKAQLEGVYLSNNPAVGTASQLNVNMDVVAASSHDIQLTSSDPTVVAVPATITVPTGQSNASISVTPLKQGDTVVTATFNGISRQLDIHVGSAGYSLQLYGQNRYAVGTIGQLSISTGTNTPTTVMLSSSDPTVISVPSSIVVANYSETAPLNVLKAGNVTLTASTPSASATYQISVVSSPSISYFGPTFNVNVNGSTNGYVQLDTAPPLGTQITFTSSNTGVVPAPAPITITSQGQTSANVVIQATGQSGTAIISATVGTSAASAVVYVGGSTSGGGGTFTGLYSYCGYSTVEVGASTLFYAYYGTPSPTGDSGTIAFGTSGIATTPSTNLTIASNAYESYFPVTGAVAGTSSIIVTTTSGTQSNSVTVVSTPTYTLSVPSTFKVGSTVSATIQSNAIVAANRTFMLSSTNQGVAAALSASSTIGPSNCSTSTTFGVKGVAAGTATINAVIGSTTLTANVTVSP